MSPERIESKPYADASDIWHARTHAAPRDRRRADGYGRSMGLCLVNAATGKHPYSTDGLSYWNLMSAIVHGEAPRIGCDFAATTTPRLYAVRSFARDSDNFSAELRNFVENW
jgi:hypothetical protein